MQPYGPMATQIGFMRCKGTASGVWLAGHYLMRAEGLCDCAANLSRWTTACWGSIGCGAAISWREEQPAYKTAVFVLPI